MVSQFSAVVATMALWIHFEANLLQGSLNGRSSDTIERSKQHEATPQLQDDVHVNPMLAALDRIRPVMKVVRKYHPEATFLAFGDQLHFEDSTQLHIERAIGNDSGANGKVIVVRGPKPNNGVWCDINLVEGDDQTFDAKRIERRHFTEHVIVQGLVETGFQLQATVRIPKGDGNDEFLEALTSLLQSYSHDFVTDK